MKREALLAVAVGAVMAAPAESHDTWILPSSFRLAAGGAVELEMTSGMGFPRNETAVAADRIADSGLRMGATRAPLTPGEAQGGALRLSAASPGAGTAVAWAVSRPRTIEIKPDQIDHYLEEIAADARHAEAWKKRGRPAIRDTYFKVAKTYVRVGDGGSDDGWKAAVGLPLELVPESNPTTYRTGQTAAWRLLWQGVPLQDTAVVAVRAGGGKPVVLRPDASGRVSFTIDGPGPWLLKATRLDTSAEAAGEWTSQFTTVTFDAGER